MTDDFGDKDHDRLAAEALISRVSRRFALGSRSDAGGRGGKLFYKLKGEQAPGPQPSRLAREAVPGAEKRSWDAGGGVDV